MGKMIIVPEPHISSTNIESRNDYLGEIKSYLNSINDFIVGNEDVEFVSFVGDVFNRGFTDIDEYFYWVDWFRSLNDLLDKRGGKIYSAVGNHELTYSKGNPFWRFLSSKDAGFNTESKWSNRSAFPIGLKSLIHIEDVIDFEDVSVFYCHYDRIADCENKVNEHIQKYGKDRHRICISHNSIISNEIAGVLRDNYGRDPLTHFIQHEQITSYDLFSKFDYVFNGHMHKACSRFILTDEETGKETMLFYLGSLGRTNSDEVNDKDLTRVCPVINLSDFRVELLPIQLFDRKTSLRENYEVEKEVQHVKKRDYVEICSRLEDVEKPIKTIMNSLVDVDMLIALECAVSSERPQKLEDLVSRNWRSINGRT